jgi:hypothetical protein
MGCSFFILSQKKEENLTIYFLKMTTPSGLTFGETTPSGLTFGEPYNLKVLVSNTINCAKQDIQNRLDSSIPEGGELV